MDQRERIRKKNKERDWRPVQGEVAIHFLEELRQARLAAQKDAEAFDEVLFVFERIGSYRLGEVSTLGNYGPSLLQLAAESSLGKALFPHQQTWHTKADVLYPLVANARNDALHQGAKARYLTGHCIELALILEDALMNGREPMTTVGDIMVRSPMTADYWHPVSLARKTMLANSFSYLPIKVCDEWMILSDVKLVSFLKNGGSKSEDRKMRLAMSLTEARSHGLLFDVPANSKPCLNTTPLDEIEFDALERPLLVTDRAGNLVGIVTAFDVL
ncbi:hypothetical protein LOC67_20135 [Stieleria sp. JC731]|uniref:CBS domain-containing protein n=1 Tax=Pirellulaceae TaxID=2691357 RepID=UPI001E434AAC|nr:hypothetical protein [Stieleria sp. JC731]MCC9602866.1 hypothetical protein [Stieleria sp. JC731]